MAITMQAAIAAYRAGNNAGNGYAPYTDVPGDNTVENAVAAAVADGGDVVLAATSADDVTALRMADGGLLLIGGDAMGRSAWAVDARNEEEGNVVATFSTERR